MKEIILKRYYHNDCTSGKMKFTIKPKSNSRIKEERAITIYNSMNNNINNPNIAFLLCKNSLKNMNKIAFLYKKL